MRHHLAILWGCCPIATELIVTVDDLVLNKIDDATGA